MTRETQKRLSSFPAPRWVKEADASRIVASNSPRIAHQASTPQTNGALHASRSSVVPAPEWVRLELARRGHWQSIYTIQSLPRLDTPGHVNEHFTTTESDE
jgi:hypothetical protein